MTSIFFSTHTLYASLNLKLKEGLHTNIPYKVLESWVMDLFKNKIKRKMIKVLVKNRAQGTVSFEWHIEDVKRIIRERNIKFKRGQELTDDDCFAVLSKVVERHDSNEGINNDIIEFWLHNMYRTRISNGRDVIYGYYR